MVLYLEKYRNSYRNSLCYKYWNWNINSNRTGKSLIKIKPFWIAIRKIAAIFTTCSISVLIVLGRVFRGGHGGRLMQKTMSTASRGKLMWGIVLVMSMILGGFSVFCIIGNSQNPNSEFNKKRRRSGQ